MGQDATFAQTLNGHNSVIFYPILKIRPHQINQLIETNRMVLIPKLYLLPFRFGFFGPFLLQGLIWATMGAWTKNLSNHVGTFPGHHLQLIAWNLVFEIFRGEPPKIKMLICNWRLTGHVTRAIVTQQDVTRANSNWYTISRKGMFDAIQTRRGKCWVKAWLSLAGII